MCYRCQHIKENNKSIAKKQSMTNLKENKNKEGNNALKSDASKDNFQKNCTCCLKLI